MVTGIVITVAEKVYAVLHSQELAEICSMFGYKSQLDELKNTVLTIKSVLLDAESKHQELTHGGRDYIERLKDAVYDVDDLLDEFNTMVQKKNNKKGGKVSKKVRRFFSRSNQFLVAFNMCRDIKNLRSKLDKIARDRQQFGFSDVYVPLKRREETMSFASEDNIIGRETDKEAIVGMLVGDSESSNDVDYVTIVGIGGLGKTALAQLVYNDCRIEKAFELKLWVCVSDDFVLDKIFRQMLGKDGSKIEELQREVRNLIQGKRYLLVLDDVWNESRDEWDNLKSFLNLGGKGSRILVTSRSKKVAKVVGDDRSMYELKGLSDENSWNLFKRLAFEQGKEPDSNDHLFDIGKEIVKKCVNVPLSIRLVGSMLYDQDERKWLSLRSANLMEFRQDEGSIMPILKYSYYHLTPALKSCFSYCALFPKDFVIKKELLIRLWLAQGCLDKPRDCWSEEDVGEEYFSILLQRCFLQDVEKDGCGEIEYFKMHDLIHDLALQVAGKETIMFNSTKGRFDKRICHLSLTENGCSMLETPSTQLREMKKLRTFHIVGLLGYNPKLLESNLSTICSQLRRLRTLNLNFVQFDTLPDAVGNLLHLRYLDLSRNSRLMVLPDSITKLINLLVLNLDETGINELRQDMKKLVNLRHLSLRYCYELRHMPSGLDTLTSLHSLTWFVAGDETSNQGRIGKLSDLKALVSLRGDLTVVFDCDFSCNVSEYENIELLRITQLTHLTLQFFVQGAIHETILTCLQPHSRLKTLEIERYKGSKLPTWSESLTTSLPHLVIIKLKKFDSLEILPSMSQLRHLKYLELHGISNVEFMEIDVVDVPSDDQLPFFPSLEELQLYGLPKLKGWWREETSRVTGEANSSSLVVPSFPCLSMLILVECPNLKTFPSSPKLISAGFRGCHEELTLLGSKTAIQNNPTTGLVLCLEKLTVDDVGAFGCLFEESLVGIHQLSIANFKGESFSNIPQNFVRHVSSVEKLELVCCPNLKSMLLTLRVSPQNFVEHLTNLKSLTISYCKNLELENNEEGVTVTPWKSLQLLSSLTLCCLPKLSNLPKEFQYLTSLEFLDIRYCANLEALPEWLNCLTSLQELTIDGCGKLKALPEAIGQMPSLKTLDLLLASEDLMKRCRKPDGEDWPKICRIPRSIVEWEDLRS